MRALRWLNRILIKEERKAGNKIRAGSSCKQSRVWAELKRKQRLYEISDSIRSDYSSTLSDAAASLGKMLRR